jgi:hypothetical protein
MRFKMKNTLKNNRYHTSKHYHMFEKPVWSLKKKKGKKLYNLLGPFLTCLPSAFARSWFFL